MKNKLLNILLVSIGITVLGLLLDDDKKEPNTIMRFVEFFAMVEIVFILCSIIYLLVNYTLNKMKAIKS